MSNLETTMQQSDTIRIEVRSFDDLYEASKRAEIRKPYWDIALLVPKSDKNPRGWRDTIYSKDDVERVGGAGDKLLTLHSHRNTAGAQDRNTDADDDRARALGRAFARGDTVTIVVR